MFENLGNFAELMRNAGKIRENIEKATESLGRIEVEGSAGGGGVRARVNGRLDVLAVQIDPKLIADGDQELIEDLVVAAVNDALVRAREAATQELSSSVPVPPFFTSASVRFKLVTSMRSRVPPA